MSELQKKGAPDLWWGGSLVELKRGKDRLSDDQRKWHRHYYIRHATYPMVVYYNGRDDYFRVFENYMQFDDWCAGNIQRDEQYLPELNYCLRKEYALLNESGRGRGPGVTTEQLALVKTLRSEGKSFRVIAEQTGIPKSTIIYNLNKEEMCRSLSTTVSAAASTANG